MPAGRQGIRKAGRSTQGKVRGLRTGAAFPEDIMAARRDRVAQASKALGKGSTMEITFEEKVSYSMDLRKATVRRELADYLDVTVKDLAKMVDRGTLFELHEDQLTQWLESKRKSWEPTETHPIEIDQIQG